MMQKEIESEEKLDEFIEKNALPLRIWEGGIILQSVL
jgi:hypothetical protein